mgnify:CR=1 FL=1
MKCLGTTCIRGRRTVAAGEFSQYPLSIDSRKIVFKTARVVAPVWGGRDFYSLLIFCRASLGCWVCTGTGSGRRKCIASIAVSSCVPAGRCRQARFWLCQCGQGNSEQSKKKDRSHTRFCIAKCTTIPTDPSIFQYAEFSGVEILNGLLDLRPLVHQKWTIGGDGFVDGFTRQHQDHRILFGTYLYLFAIL